MSLFERVDWSSPAFIGLSSSVVAYSLYLLIGPVFQSPALNALPGPAFEGLALVAPFKGESTTRMMELIAQYGPVFSFKRRFSRPVLVVADVRAVAHILQHSQAYDKLPSGSRPLATMLGTGLLVATGDEHRIQRKVLNPAFGPSQIRALTNVFLDKANELRDRLSILSSSSEPVNVEIIDWVSRCTLDIIGLGGFGYDFAALDGSQQSEMLVVVNKIMRAGTRKIPLVLQLLMKVFPTLPMALNKTIRDNVLAMQRIGMGLVNERKAEASAVGGAKLKQSRDLLSLLVKANLSSGSREKLSDIDMLGQIPTFLLAGHETTATLLTWILYQLCLQPSIQTELRAECRSFALPSQATGNSPLEADELATFDKLPLLDAVVRETLRLNSPVAFTTRMALVDDVVPLSSPVLGAKSASQGGLPLKKGDPIVIPIFAIHQAEKLWGPDAKEWKPTRWIDGPPEAIRAIPGVWGHMLSFLGGAHACIGYRFSLYETKIILHALLTKFEFSLAVPKEDIVVKSNVISRPFLRDQEEKGPKLPLLMRPAKVEE